MPTPIPQIDVSIVPVTGIWNGTTSQGKPITFATDAAGVRSFSVGWTATGCGTISGQTTNSYPSNPPLIEASHFTAYAEAPTGQTGYVLLSGDFTTATSVGGRLSVNIFGSLDAAGTACGGGNTADVGWTATAAGH